MEEIMRRYIQDVRSKVNAKQEEKERKKCLDVQNCALIIYPYNQRGAER